jgi:PAS domain-containing protein
VAEEVIGKHITILIPPDRRAEEDTILQRIRGGQCVEHFETVRQRKDGSLIDISLPEGHIQIEWSRAPDKRLILRWTETRGPLVMAPTCRGFGTRVMESMIRDQLGGELRLNWRAEGLACEIAVTA